MAKAANRFFSLMFVVALHELRGHIAIHEDACSPVGTRTTSNGAVLMQSASVKNRFSRGRSGDDHAAEVEMLASAIPLNRTDLRSSSKSLGASANFSTMAGLVQSPSTDTTSWLSSFTKHISHDNSGPLMFIVLLLLLAMIGAAVCLWKQPAMKGLVGGSADERFPTVGQGQPSNYVRAMSTHSPLMSSRAQASAHPTAGRSPPLSNRRVAGRSNPPCRALADEGPTPEDVDDDFTVSRLNTVDSQFCPDLIVPMHNECILFMPLDADRTNSSFEITDSHGHAVLRVVLEPATAGRLWRATVTKINGDLLVQCCEARSQTAGGYAPEFQFMRTSGQLWATLVQSSTPDRYLLSLLGGGTLHIFGSFEQNAINITDDQNRLYANTEVAPADFDKATRYSKVRVAPLADVGLALCGFLGVRQFIGSQRRWVKENQNERRW